jgi:hypothetical protein
MENTPQPQSVVSACDVTDCTFNRAQQCHAGSIQVALVDGMAHCATYSPREGAMGTSSSATPAATPRASNERIP